MDEFIIQRRLSLRILRSLAALLLATIGGTIAAGADKMVKTPPATADEAGIVADTPDPAVIDPGAVKATPATEPKEDPASGAIVSGTCVKAGKTIAALNSKRCAKGGGIWRDGKIKTPSANAEPLIPK